MKTFPNNRGIYTALKANLTNIQERDKALHSVHCGIKLSPFQKTTPSFLPAPSLPPPLNLETIQAPVFSQSLAIFWFVLTPPKTHIFR